jgi:hypothetical protein
VDRPRRNDHRGDARRRAAAAPGEDADEPDLRQVQPYGTVLAMTPSAQDKLGKLLRMLSSDKDGEVLAATAAIKRTLANEGLDIHSLADALCRPAPRSEAPYETTGWSDDRANSTDWYSVACQCEAHGAFLNLREQQFISDMVFWTRYARPSERATGLAAHHP